MRTGGEAVAGPARTECRQRRSRRGGGGGRASIDVDVRDVDVPLSRSAGSRPRRLVAGSLRCLTKSVPRSCCPRLICAPGKPPRRFATAGGVAGRASRSSTSACASASSAFFDRLTAMASAQKSRSRRSIAACSANSTTGAWWRELGRRDPSAARALDTISLHHADRRVLIVCHQVVVFCLRYILEEMDEAGDPHIDKKLACTRRKPTPWHDPETQADAYQGTGQSGAKGEDGYPTLGEHALADDRSGEVARYPVELAWYECLEITALCHESVGDGAAGHRGDLYDLGGEPTVHDRQQCAQGC